jgi:tubulin gamma
MFIRLTRHLAGKPKMTQSKDQKIAEAQANLPLPEQPATASDWQSADARTVNVGSGRTEANIGTSGASNAGLREPASKDAQDLSNVGRQAVEGLSGPPKDAASRK